ncbi:MAG TPA: PAS domain S-box protein, partial [Chthonomonadales bacterium]|nr:PAS domain S-box protein [Chthonomonadales bacterium]
MNMGASARTRVPVMIWLAACLVAIIFAAAYVNLRLVAAERTAAARSRSARLELFQTLNLLEDAETGERGYLLTGKRLYLQPYYSARQFLPSELALLRRLLQRSPSERHEIDLITSLARLKMLEMQQIIALRNEHKEADAIRIVNNGQGNVVMGRIRNVISTTYLAETGDLLDREAREAAYTRNTLIIIVGGSLVLFTLLALAAIAVRRELIYRHQAETALRASEQNYATTLRSIGDAVIATGADGHIRFMNGAAELLTGWRLEEALGKNAAEVFRLVNLQSRSEVESPIVRVLRDGEPVGLANDTLLISKDGSEHPIDDSGAPIRDGKGALIGSVLVFRDISRRKELEQAIRDSESRLRAIVETAVDAVITIDQEGVVQSFNAAAQRIFGYSSEEVIGRNISMLMPEPYRQEHDGYLSAYLETGVAKVIGIGREAVGMRKGGSTFPMDLAVSEFRAGSRRLFAGFVRDITDRKRADSDREAHLAEIRQLNIRLQRAMAESHHRIKNQLQMLAALLDMSLGEMDTIPRSSLSRLTSHIQALAALHDMLTIESKSGGDTEAVPFRSALEKLLPTLQVSAGGRRLNAEIDDLSFSLKRAGSLLLL